MRPLASTSLNAISSAFRAAIVALCHRANVRPEKLCFNPDVASAKMTGNIETVFRFAAFAAELNLLKEHSPLIKFYRQNLFLHKLTPFFGV